MTYYPDMGTVTMVATGPHVRAIGWLSRYFEFPRGSVPKSFVKRLRLFTTSESDRILGFPLFLGFHECELCNGKKGTRTFGVPAGDVLFVGPELVAHYVEKHQYCPPTEFVDAVMNSPTPGSEAYRDSIKPFRHLEQTVTKEEWARVEQAHAEKQEKMWRAIEEDIAVRFPVGAERGLQPSGGESKRPSARRALAGPGLALAGVATGAAGILFGDTDAAPAAALIGILLMVGGLVLALRLSRRKA